MSDATDLKVLLVSSEITPYAKSGGLGDVIGSLPRALRRCGVDARVVFPKYKTIKPEYKDKLKPVSSFRMNLDWRNQGASVYTIDSCVPTYLIENDYYFGRDGFYGYGDDYERFAFFSMASIWLLNFIDFEPDIIHFNDWQTGVGCVHLKDNFGQFIKLSKIKSLFTIHNLQYQGMYGREILRSIGLNDGYFTKDKLEFYGRVSMMKAGLVYADAISTVSRTYTDEIQRPEYGFSMEGVIRSRAASLHGIINGIDTDANDPETDKRLFVNFNKEDLRGKKENKQKLQELLGLPQRDVPMISIISRLVDQKGLDLIYVALDEILSKDIQFVVLGTGDLHYENLFRNMAWRAPHKVSANIYFNEDLAQKIYGASDMFLMPSLFEPCGLGQLFAMRYGTVPIARRTGGLADTIDHFNQEARTGNGFLFNDYDARGMMWAVNEALRVYYNDPDGWIALIKNAMSGDFSWLKSAEKYVELYLKLKDGSLAS